MAEHRSITFALSDLATEDPFPEPTGDVVVVVPDEYLDDERFNEKGAEALAIQRLITLAHNHTSLRFEWGNAVSKRVATSPSVLPLAAVALCLNNATHSFATSSQSHSQTREMARLALAKHRLTSDMFSDRQVLICLDGQSPSLPFDLYNPESKKLRPEPDFESLVDDLIFAQQGAGFPAGQVSRLRLALAVILRELLENTDDHAKTDADGAALQANAIRGLIVKRVLEPRHLPNSGDFNTPSIPCLEFTVFDSGIGYYDSYRRQLLRGQARGEPLAIGDSQAEIVRRFALGPQVPIGTEYAVVLKCLERHSDRAIPDPRPGHRGMGLYEVLRALKTMEGMLEVRTGRIHGYRSFLRGELKVQLEPESSPTRPGMPKATLLDVSRRLTTQPTQHETVRGSVVRVVVPLA